MTRSGRHALAVVLLVATFVLVALAERPAQDDGAVRGRVRRQSPWLHRSPNTFALGKKFARQRPSASASNIAVETNTIWPLGKKGSPSSTQARPLELPAEVERKPATRSRAFYGCMSNCLTLSQYNPVCGTDQTTYHNEYKLECANRCGARPRVSIRKMGIC